MTSDGDVRRGGEIVNDATTFVGQNTIILFKQI